LIKSNRVFFFSMYASVHLFWNLLQVQRTIQSNVICSNVMRLSVDCYVMYSKLLKHLFRIRICCILNWNYVKYAQYVDCTLVELCNRNSKLFYRTQTNWWLRCYNTFCSIDINCFTLTTSTSELLKLITNIYRRHIRTA
jgi:hypothetical protein